MRTCPNSPIGSCNLMSRFRGAAPMKLLTIVCVLGITVVATAQAPAFDLSRQSAGGATADWPQWQGPDRTGVSKETGLLQQWPASGPPAIWSISGLGAGYGSIAVKGDRLFVQALHAAERTSTVASLNRADGKVVWRKSIGRSGNNDRGPGPRGTPTLDGNNVIVTPGGPRAGIVALDKMTGKTVWTSQQLSDEAGYSSPIAADVQGVRVYMTLTSSAGVGVRASDGKLMWRFQPVANGTANVATPVFADNKVFYTSNYGTGAALLGLSAQNGEVRAEQIYFTREMQNHHGGVVLVNGFLYGFHNTILVCLEFATGKVQWRDRSVGKGSLSYADGNLYILSEDNVVGLAAASPAGYQERGRFKIADQGLPSWAHPVVSGGVLYIRNQATLTAYNVRA